VSQQLVAGQRTCSTGLIQSLDLVICGEDKHLCLFLLDLG
jgi:hypothetical protein